MTKLALVLAACAALAACRAEDRTGEARGTERPGHVTNDPAAGAHPTQGPGRTTPPERDVNDQTAPFGQVTKPDHHATGDAAEPNRAVPKNDDLSNRGMRGSLDGGVPKPAPSSR
ncbi:MAG TPA: hypothetical protein VHB21_23570 [Minicystis sp.]|nr:hypothetical protein [Minicystis sp.]